MRKGDERKQEILQVAERLFCGKGYADTCIQDILDVMKISKGGFYHHFISKESVLETICQQRAEKAAERAAEAISAIPPEAVLERLNTLFYHMMPLRREEHDFMCMLLPLLDKPESVTVRIGYQLALQQSFVPLLEKAILSAREQGVICPPVRDVVLPVLLMANQCWLDAALVLLDGIQKAQPYDLAALLGILECYRKCIEVLLDAPYGSILLLDLEEWNAAAEAMFKQLRIIQ